MLFSCAVEKYTVASNVAAAEILKTNIIRRIRSLLLTPRQTRRAHLPAGYRGHNRSARINGIMIQGLKNVFTPRASRNLEVV